MACLDPIVLQQLLDGELDETQAGFVARHVEICIACSAVARELSALRAFVQERLGADDEGEEDAASAALAAIAARLPAAATPSSPRARLWRRPWLAAAAAAIVSLLLPLAPGSRVDASPERILMEAVARERMWAYQPDKVLRWDVEALSSGIKGIADGRWRSTFWQKNGRSTFSQVWRQFDPRGQIARATWRREDGSVLVFRPDGRDVVEILPSAAEARAALPGLEPKLRNALTAYLDRQESLRTLDFHSRRLAEWLNQPALRTPGAVATLRGGVVAEWGETYHITVVNARPRGSPSILRAVHEYDVEKASYRLLRLKSTVTYADGTTGLHESRWMGYREATDAEFEAHVPLELLRIGAPVVHVTPRELAMRHLRDLSRALTSPN